MLFPPKLMKTEQFFYAFQEEKHVVLKQAVLILTLQQSFLEDFSKDGKFLKLFLWGPDKMENQS